MSLFTTDDTDGWIFVRNFLDRKKMDIEAWNNLGPTIFIVLTGKSEFVGVSKRFVFNGRYKWINRLNKISLHKLNLLYNIYKLD